MALVSLYSHCLGFLIHFWALNIINMLTIPKYIDPFQISLPNSRFTHLISYLTVDPDILRDISSHMSTSELLTSPCKPFLPAAFPSFRLMAAPFFQVFIRPKDPGVFLHMTFSLDLHPISQDILLTLLSKYVQILFLTISTALSFVQTTSTLSWIIAWAS